jgi:IclR family acetate operon transcriptional repressor
VPATVTTLRIVPAVDRAARILDVLARDTRDWTLTELAQELGVHKGTTRDILLTLHRHGLVERDSQSGRYRLGLGAARLARAALGRLDLRGAARPSLEKLLAETGETVLLGVRSDRSVVIIDAAEAADDLHMSASVGQKIPLIAGSFGKVFLSEPGAFEEYLEGGGELTPFTTLSQTDPDVYAAELSFVRARGYALDSEEYLPSVRAASALVKGPYGETLGAITIVGFEARISSETLEDLGQACRQEAIAITNRMGGRSGGE